MSKLIELKIWPVFFQDLGSDRKNFEVREKRDRDFQVDDVLHLREWDPSTGEYTGRELSARITYCLDDPSFVLPGYVIMGLDFGE